MNFQSEALRKTIAVCGVVIVVAVTAVSAIAREIHDAPPRPGIEEACWSVTSYWPFDQDGNLVAFNGQADGDPTVTAAMTPVSTDRAMKFVAGPLPLLEQTAAVWFHWLDEPLPVLDTFGHPDYQRGVFWHNGYDRWVIGIDIFTPEAIHYLDCDGEIIFP